AASGQYQTAPVAFTEDVGQRRRHRQLRKRLSFQLHMERSETGVTVFLDDETSFDVGIYDMHLLFDEMFNRAIAKARSATR
ncbi:hypothetical protein, partial [Pseudomonas amygdali]